MKRGNKITRAKEKAKNTPVSFVGINVSQLKLTNEEKRQFVSEGFYFSTNRKKETSLHYSQISRAKDLREKVNKKRIEKLKL